MPEIGLGSLLAAIPQGDHSKALHQCSQYYPQGDWCRALE